MMRLLLIPILFLASTGPGAAQSLATGLANGGALSETTIQLFIALTVLSLAPGIAITLTCFPLMVTVLAILRQALGLQQSPPNMFLISLALFLTYFVMEPVFLQAWADGVQPYLDQKISLAEGFTAVFEPFRTFMEPRINPDTLIALENLRPAAAAEDAAPSMSTLIPAFLLSEVEKAFQIGFFVFMPFLIIDLVVSAVLMSMGMMMVPPALVALPFKLVFFVVVDGWTLIATSLVASYG